MGRKVEDLTGKRFERLTVIKREENRNGRIMWLCKCDCGNERVVRGEHLKNGSIKSCGCLQKEIARETRKGITVTEETKRKLSELHKDKPLSEKHKQKLSKSKYGKYRGKESPNYNPDLTDEERQDRRLQEGYDEWCYKVKEQANFICDCCGKRGGELCSHHLNNYRDYLEERLNIDNGVCLCRSCHKEFHAWMGGTKIKCTKEDYIKFKNKKKQK